MTTTTTQVASTHPRTLAQNSNKTNATRDPMKTTTQAAFIHPHLPLHKEKSPTTIPSQAQRNINPAPIFFPPQIIHVNPAPPPPPKPQIIVVTSSVNPAQQTPQIMP